jgi:hypothetical protein
MTERPGGMKAQMRGMLSLPGDRIASERIYRDQAAALPVGGVEVTRKAVDVASVPSNAVITR